MKFQFAIAACVTVTAVRVRYQRENIAARDTGHQLSFAACCVTCWSHGEGRTQCVAPPGGEIFLKAACHGGQLTTDNN